MKAITLKRLNEVIEADQNIGFCVSCGESRRHIPQHGKNYGCHACGHFTVFGVRYIRKMNWFSSS